MADDRDRWSAELIFSRKKSATKGGLVASITVPETDDERCDRAAGRTGHGRRHLAARRLPRLLRLLLELPYSVPLAAVVALVPAALRWYWGRFLAPLADDPVFPERLVAHRFRTGRSFGIAFALLLVLLPHTLLWSLPLLILSCTVASFRFRRIIYRESWGLAAYLSFVTRAVVAIFGFWLLLAALPALAVLAGPHGWLVAPVLGLVLVIWNARYVDAVRVLLRSTAIENPALVAKFTALAQASTARMPRFEQTCLGGGAIANAIALPSLSRSIVLFTDTLLSRLDDDECVAICGHELAHLEHYKPVDRTRCGRVASPRLGCTRPHSARAGHDWRSRYRGHALDVAGRSTDLAHGRRRVRERRPARRNAIRQRCQLRGAVESVHVPASWRCGLAPVAYQAGQSPGSWDFQDRDRLLSQRHRGRAAGVQRVRRDTDTGCFGRSRNGELSAIGILDGRFDSDDHPPAGWLTGWYDSTPAALRLSTRELVTLPDRQHGLVGLATSARSLGTITADGGRVKIRLFPLSM